MTMTEAEAYAREDRVRRLWNAYEAFPELLGAKGFDAVDRLRSMADGYVWGREDAGNRAWFDSHEFGLAYGVHAAQYAAGERSSRTNIRNAYEQYVRHEPIN
jgi:hypothetical protein